MKYLIQGLTSSGSIFRPSDWAERLCTVLAQYRTDSTLRSIDEARNHKMQGYSNCIFPVVVSRVKAVVVDDKLKDLEPLAFEFAMNFAQDNNLTILENYDVTVIASREVA